MNPRLLIVGLLAGLSATQAQGVAVKAEHVEAELVSERTAWLPGTTNWVALRLQPEDGWHTYWRNPGDSGLATRIEWRLPEGWTAGEIHWPHPEPHRLGDLVNYGYGAETLHLVPLQLPENVRGHVSVSATAHWLVCADICIPGQAELELRLPATDIATAEPSWTVAFAYARRHLPEPGPLAGRFEVTDGEVRLEVDQPQTNAPIREAMFYAWANDLVNHGAPQRLAIDGDTLRFTQDLSPYFAAGPQRIGGVLVTRSNATRAWVVEAVPGAVARVAPVTGDEIVATGDRLTFLTALLFAFLGGLILNLMPCVFPVLSIKAISVLESRESDGHSHRGHAFAYVVGVVGSFVAVAGLLLALRSGGAALGWGFQLQSPAFNTVLAYLLFGMGLSMSGVLMIGTNLMGIGQSLTEKGGYTGSFFTGVLATVVASPCTAPFMGTALGFAIAQPAADALAVFAMLGFGLALPFFLLGMVPQLGRLLPRPGPWMETFKQVMAFPMYLTVVWLVWVFGRQVGADAAAALLAGLVVVAFAAWLWGRGGGPLRGAVALGLLALAVALPLQPGLHAGPDLETVGGATTTEASGRWSEARITALRAQGQAVFVIFTADWCITCKVNEKVVLDTDAVRAAFAARDITWLTADWTRPDPEITRALGKFGRNGVPLYLLYPPHDEPRVLPQILTETIILQALSEWPDKETP